MTTATRHARLIDVVGVVVVVVAMVIGLVPGVGSVPAGASTSVSADLDQCANDDTPTDGTRDACSWQNGNLNVNNSVYAEGDSVGFRVILTGLTVGHGYEVPINYDILNSGYVAYDQLTSWNRTESGAPSGGAAVTATIPLDPRAAAHGIPQATPAEVALYGGTWELVDPVEYSSGGGALPASGSTTSELDLRFVATSSTAVLAWGGHIALRQDWNSEGYTTAPQETNGSPYHMRLGNDLGTRAPGETTYTTSQLGNQDRSLKSNAVILPGGMRILKLDANGNALSGFGFEVRDGQGGLVFSCTTDEDGLCATPELPIGTYSVVEVSVPDGYLIDSTPRPVVVTEGGTAEVEYVNERIDYTIGVAQDGRNAIGEPHTFTVTLTADGDEAVGETVALAWSGTGDITAVNGGAAAASCVTDANGQCTVVVQSDDPGSGTLTATFTTPYQGASGDGGTATAGDNVATIHDSGEKVWIGYRATLGDTGLNLLGDAHTFTATVYETDGTTETLAQDVEVTVVWSGPTDSTIDGAATTTTCTTDATGTCAVEVDSDTTPGTGTASITQLSGSIGTEPLDVTYTVDQDAPAADKTWRELRARIDDNSVNPVGQAHTFTVTIEQRDSAGDDDWAAVGAGVQVEVGYAGLVGSVDDDAGTCDTGTVADGTCTVVVTSDNPGTGTVTVTGVSGDLLDEGGSTTVSYDVDDAAATKTWLDFAVDIEPSAVNQVDEAHTFRVTVQVSDGSGFEPVDAGTKLLWTPSGDGDVTADTCTTTGTGNDLDTPATETNVCFISVDSADPGTFTATVTGLDDVQFTGRTEDITFAQPAIATKTWIAYRAWIEADATNLVGDPHTFTVTAQQDAGDGWDEVPDGTVVTVGSTGSGSIDTDGCASGTSSGTCDVTVVDDGPGTLEVQVLTVSADDAVDSASDTADVSAGADLQEPASTTATKTWLAYAATISDDATNLTGEAHSFRVEATVDDGAGPQPVPAGTVVEVDVDAAFLVEDTCATGTGDDGATVPVETHVCTVTVTSDAPASTTVTVTGVTPGDGTLDGPTQTATQSDVSGTKTWIAAAASIEADETNVAGDEHTFTVTALVVTSDVPAGVPASAGFTAAVSSLGTTGTITGQTCDDGNDADVGSCTVTVQSDGPGHLDVTVDSLSFTWGGVPFTVALDGSDGVADLQAQLDRTARKTWRAYRASLDADAVNLIRDDHTFTVTVQQTDVAAATELDWIAVPDGSTVGAELTGVGAVTDDSTCTDGTGTTGGLCTVVVRSAVPGTSTVTVTTVGVDHPDGVTGSVTVDVPATQADKTWVAVRAAISNDSLNVTGDEHDFTLSAEYTTNGSTWTAAPAGSSIGFTTSGPAGPVVDADTCDATSAAGTCSVTVQSDVAGSIVVEVTTVDLASTTIDGIVVDLQEVTLVDDAVGVADGTDTSVASTKRWGAYGLELTPDQAVNLLDGSADDPERDHVITAVLTSDDGQLLPVGGQEIDVVLSGDGTIVAVEDGSIVPGGASATCVTAPDGTCDVTLRTDGPGQAVLSGSYEATVGDSAPVTVEAGDAVKVWTTFRVTVTPEQATNLVGNAHVFTVLVEQSSPAATCGEDWCPVVGSTPTIDVAGVAVTTDATDCAAGTDVSGACTVTVSSATVQAITLTATHVEDRTEYSSGTGTAAFTDTGDKAWIDHAIDIDPLTAENLVGTEHVFTVTVTTTFPGQDGPTTVPVPGALPDVELAGVGAITDDECATVGTDADGACRVTVTSAAPGTSTLRATYLGTASDDEELREYAAEADKLWVAFDLTLDPPTAINALGDEHVFTATLTIDIGDGPVPAAGETLTFTVDGVGTVTGGTVDELLTCTVAADGICTIAVTSDEPGTTTVGVSHDAVVGPTEETTNRTATKQWVDVELVKTAVVGDGIGDGDLVADPGTGIPTLFFTSSDRGPKTAVFEYTVTNTGPVPLQGVELTDDRLGVVIGLAEDVVLAPGASITRRVGESFSYDDAAGVLGGLVVNVGVVGAEAEDGTRVGDTDDAVIQLVAQQSSILLDLVKSVIIGDDVTQSPDGLPTVSWTGEEFDADAPKLVGYRFTVTNVGSATIVDLELTDPMIDALPLLEVADGVTLQPGESTEVTADVVVRPSDLDGAGELVNVATVRGANETRDSFDEDSDDAIVFITVVRAEVEVQPEILPATGLMASGLVPAAILLLALGAAVLWVERRVRVVGRAG